jgi:hypothetical protein
LEDLPAQVREAQAIVTKREADLNRARTLHAEMRRQADEQQGRLLTANMLVGIGAAVSWFCVLFMSRGRAAFYFLLLAMGFSLGMIVIYRYAEHCQSSTGARTLDSSSAQLNDLLIEQELCSDRVLGYRYSERPVCQSLLVQASQRRAA